MQTLDLGIIPNDSFDASAGVASSTATFTP